MRRNVGLGLAAVFLVVVEGLGLSDWVPWPVALLIGAGWAVLVGLAGLAIARRPRLAAWTEDVLVGAGVVAMGIFAFGGAVGILMWNAAMDSPSITGETMMAMFLPSIPIAIAANVPSELIIFPLLLIVGRRRLLLVAAAAVYFVLRIWTYLVFAGDRLDFAFHQGSTGPMTDGERSQIEAGMHLHDPRWMVNFVIFALFLLAAFTPARASRSAAPTPAASR